MIKCLKKKEYEDECFKKQSLIYPSNQIPKNYFFDDNVLINEVFYNVFEEYMSVDETFKNLELFYNKSLDYIKDKMIEKNFIEEKLDMSRFDEEIIKFTDKKLKKTISVFQIQRI